MGTGKLLLILCAMWVVLLPLAIWLTALIFDRNRKPKPRPPRPDAEPVPVVPGAPPPELDPGAESDLLERFNEVWARRQAEEAAAAVEVEKER